MTQSDTCLACGRPIEDGAAEWHADPKERLSRDRDIILEAINFYDEWMLDDDYDAQTCLRTIIEKMRSRAALEGKTP